MDLPSSQSVLADNNPRIGRQARGTEAEIVRPDSDAYALAAQVIADLADRTEQIGRTPLSRARVHRLALLDEVLGNYRRFEWRLGLYAPYSPDLADAIDLLEESRAIHVFEGTIRVAPQLRVLNAGPSTQPALTTWLGCVPDLLDCSATIAYFAHRSAIQRHSRRELLDAVRRYGGRRWSAISIDRAAELLTSEGMLTR